MVEYGHKIEEKMKSMKMKSSKIHTEPTVKGRKPELKSTVWNRRKK